MNAVPDMAALSNTIRVFLGSDKQKDFAIPKFETNIPPSQIDLKNLFEENLEKMLGNRDHCQYLIF
jgi:hypothetical protein